MVSNGIWKNLDVLGGKIPKKIDDPIRIRDEELSKQVENMFMVFNDNIKNGIWDLKDYKDFRGEIAKINVDLFKKAYPFIMSLITLPKIALEMYCHYLDETFSLHIYSGVGEEFSTKEVVVVVRGILSKLTQYSSIVTNWYDKNTNNKDNVQQEISDLELLLEKLNNDDQDLISFILDRYSEFLTLAGDDEELRNAITVSFEEIVDANKKNLNSRIRRYSNCYEIRNNIIPNDVYFDSVRRCKKKKLS